MFHLGGMACLGGVVWHVSSGRRGLSGRCDLACFIWEAWLVWEALPRHFRFVYMSTFVVT